MKTLKTATTRDQVLELYDMLSTCRPHLSSVEEEFIGEFITPLGVERDTFGNLYKRIGTAPVMWSCHTDTVHHKEGIQEIQLRNKRTIELHKHEKSSCLGADDTAGVWLMCQMIKAETPGLYVFHRGEEVGCLGSKWIAKNNKGLLDGIQACIALDRKDFNNLITFQRGDRCCSDDFGRSLSEEINSIMWENEHLDYTNDDTGIYTDSASYVDIIGECTNLSVGYSGQHGKGEKLDMFHLAYLREALIRIDLSKLRYSRVAGTKESKWGNAYGGAFGGYGRRHWDEGDDWVSEYGGGEYMNSGTRKWYVDHYHYGYQDLKSNKWVSQSLSEWQKWRSKILVKGNKPDQYKHVARVWDPTTKCFVSVDADKPAVSSKLLPATTNFKETLSRQDNKPMVPRPQPEEEIIGWKTEENGGETKTIPVYGSKVDLATMAALIINNPEAVARMLMDWGYDTPQARDAIFEYSTIQGKFSTGKEEKPEEKTPIAPKEEGAPTIQ